MSYYIHQTPGRLRVRTPAIKDRPEAARAAYDRLKDLSGIHVVRSNPLTGSVTVTYDAALLQPAVILRHLHDGELLSGVVGLSGPQPLRPRLVPPRQRPRLRLVRAAAAAPAPVYEEARVTLSPTAKKLLLAAAKAVLPVLAERAFGKPGRLLVCAFL